MLVGFFSWGGGEASKSDVGGNVCLFFIFVGVFLGGGGGQEHRLAAFTLFLILFVHFFIVHIYTTEIDTYLET